MRSHLTDRVIAFVDTPDVRLFVAVDPDRILSQEEPAAALLARHAAVLPFESPVEFRYLYETQYRHGSNVLVVLTEGDISRVPADVLSRARVVRIELSTFFPHLATEVLRQVPYAILARLYDAQDLQTADLTVRETARIVAEKGYDISAASVSSEETLYATLLRLHLHEQPLPECVADYVVGIWRQDARYAEIPLERLIRNRRAFLDYLQQHWNAWASAQLGGQLSVSTVSDASLAAAYRRPSATSATPIVPWASLSVRTVIDDYFDMSLLEPVHAVSRDGIPAWARCGIMVDEGEYVSRRIDKLTAMLDDPRQSWDVAAWGAVVRDLGLLLARYYAMQNATGTMASDVGTLLGSINEHFDTWLRTNYDASLSLAYVPRPSSVHQIAPYLAAARQGRIALIVMDGMNWWQWSILARGLEEHGLHVDDLASVLACIPTITSISRSAIFAGRLPRSFFHLGSTPDETSLWQSFWTGNGLAPEQALLHVVGPTSSLDQSLERALLSSVRVFGAVVPQVDELIHGEGLTPRMLAAAIRKWVADGDLANYLGALLDAGYDIYLTADHGNTAALGIGPCATGILAESNGRRARIFESEVVRDDFVQARSEFTEAWESASLPEGVHAALCRGNRAFAPQNQAVNCHGGISLLEVMVPFARIAKER